MDYVLLGALGGSFVAVAGAGVCLWMSVRTVRMAALLVSAADARADQKIQNKDLIVERDRLTVELAAANDSLKNQDRALLNVRALNKSLYEKLRSYESDAIDSAHGDDLLDVADRVLAGDDVPDGDAPAAPGRDDPP